MTDQPAETPAPAPAAHESLGHRLGDLFHREAPFAQEAAAAVAPEVKAAIRAHAGNLFDLAADAVKSPEAAALLPKMFALVEEGARIAGALHQA